LAALVALVLAMPPLSADAGPSSPASGVSGGGGMSTDASNASLPAARNNLVISRDLKLDFAAACDGTTDDAAAFSAAVNWLTSAANRVITVPAAVCATSATVVYGDGRQRSTTLSSAAS